MIGVAVFHKIWGRGTVVAITDKYITVRFPIGEKVFSLSSAYDFLTTKDADLSAELVSQKEKIKSQLKEPAPTAEKKNKASIIQPKFERTSTRKQEIKRSNIAFKCNYCDGGSSETCVGFKGACSDAMKHYNIEKEKHVWCRSDSPCRKYLDGEITAEELQASFICYESVMLTEWRARAGIVQTGKKKGKPMTLRNVHKNSLCVLTTRLPDTAEETRFIFAVFLVDESYEGDGREEGFVTSHSKWKIEMSPSEAKQLLFWNYYLNKNAPSTIRFGSGLHRYLDDFQAAQILSDIVKVKDNIEEKERAKDLLHHFCTATDIEEDKIPPCSGALQAFSGK